MKDPAKVAQALLDNHAREFKGWRNCAETRALKKRIADAIRADRLDAIREVERLRAALDRIAKQTPGLADEIVKVALVALQK